MKYLPNRGKGGMQRKARRTTKKYASLTDIGNYNRMPSRRFNSPKTIGGVLMTPRILGKKFFFLFLVL